MNNVPRPPFTASTSTTTSTKEVTYLPKRLRGRNQYLRAAASFCIRISLKFGGNSRIERDARMLDQISAIAATQPIGSMLAPAVDIDGDGRYQRCPNWSVSARIGVTFSPSRRE